MAVWTDTILGEAGQPRQSWKRFLEIAAIPPVLGLLVELLKYSTVSICLFSSCSFSAIPPQQNKPLPAQMEVVTPSNDAAARLGPSLSMPHAEFVPVPRPARHNARNRNHHFRMTEGAVSSRAPRDSEPDIADRAPPITALAPPAATQVQPLAPIDHARPLYPVRARSEGVQGEVLVAYSVDTAGAVHDPRILGSTGHGVFDNAALKAVRSWTFMPSAAPTSGRQVRFEFRLKP